MSRLLQDDSWASFSNRTHSSFIKLLVLEFLSSSVYLLDPSYLTRELLETPNLHYMLGKFHQMRPIGKVDDYIAYLKSAEYTVKILRDIVEAINIVLQALSGDSNSPYWNKAHLSQKDINEVDMDDLYHEKQFILRTVCSQRQTNLQEHYDRVSRRLEETNKILNIRESISVRRLTLLAAFFLLLSLSASIIGMQTRFAELNLLLYDFIGVFVVICALTILMYCIGLVVSRSTIRQPIPWHQPWVIWDKVKDNVSNFMNLKGYFYFNSISVYIVYTTAVVLVTASFTIGMVLNAILGLKVLGYGLSGLVLLIIPLTFVSKRWPSVVECSKGMGSRCLRRYQVPIELFKSAQLPLPSIPTGR
jgi:hypothetical protein